MQTGEVIRTYRKMKNLTQEEMAGRLGVSAPAVNKWEKGVSQPDISLLVPIARLLDISLETLLSWQEKLTDAEVEQILKETIQKLETDSYQAAFDYAADIICKYPDSHLLIVQLAAVLDTHMEDEASDCRNYKNQIEKWYKQAMESGDRMIQKTAARLLFHFYLRMEKYGEAEQYLRFFPEESADRKCSQARIYEKTDRRPEAYKAYEEVLFSEYQTLNLAMHSLAMLSLEDGLSGQAKMWMEKASSLAALFDMGEYRMTSCLFESAVQEKNVEQTWEIVQKLLDSVETLDSFSRSEMYAHMDFRQPDKGFCKKLKEELMKTFQDKETYSYMECHTGWRKLVG